MTRGEALKKMQAVKSYMTSGNPIWSVTEIGEAFDMAIEALEQPEIIRCKDCKYGGMKENEEGYCYASAIEQEITGMDYCSWAKRRET